MRHVFSWIPVTTAIRNHHYSVKKTLRDNRIHLENLPARGMTPLQIMYALQFQITNLQRFAHANN